ncbi:hypothetical protein [Paenibacillus thermotolerans]|uniref:hypothetical protein n=1 Tax=Paenibacillus thermotolerans TaxID=3027807 RepID=UPI0023686809|nr:MULTISPECIES: hypothetical protein [unclassified Paenibacillus]
MKRFLQSIIKKLTKPNMAHFSHSKDEQSRVLECSSALYQNPTLIQRSFMQYKCQVHYKSVASRVLLNSASLILIIPVVLFLLLKRIRINKNHDADSSSLIAVYMGVDLGNVPNSINNRYRVMKGSNKVSLSVSDIITVMCNFWRFLGHPYFILKNVYKTALFSHNMNVYNPSAIVVTSEYSFTSSWLTQYCRLNNIVHINIMHGEKIYNIRDSFFEFDECFVWDQHYIDLFTSLHASHNQFKTEIPPKLQLNLQTATRTDYSKNQMRLSYYLQNETEQQLNILKDALNKLRNNYHVCLRPHPVYSNINLLQTIFKEFEIEDPSSINIQQSISKADFIVSKYSTVLFQGYLLKKDIIIDDISDNELFRKLIEFDYIIFRKKHRKLTEMLHGS